MGCHAQELLGQLEAVATAQCLLRSQQPAAAPPLPPHPQLQAWQQQAAQLAGAAGLTHQQEAQLGLKHTQFVLDDVARVLQELAPPPPGLLQTQEAAADAGPPE